MNQLNPVWVTREIEDLKRQLEVVRIHGLTHVRGSPVDPIPDENIWVAVESEQTASITATESTGGTWGKTSPARNANMVIRFQFDTYAGTPTVTTRWWMDNIARTLTPTFAGFAAGNPSSLGNATDENVSVTTGAGSTLDVAVDQSYIQIDLGSTYDGYYWCRYIADRNGGITSVYIVHEVSVDGAAWTVLQTDGYGGGAAYPVTADYFNTTQQSGKRYLRVSCYGNSGVGGNEAKLTLKELCYVATVKTNTYTMGTTPSTYLYRPPADRPFLIATASSTANCTARYQMHTLVDITG